jgi:predicted O-methyltransferase YrrM
MNIPTFDEVMALTGTISNEHMLHPEECRAMYDTLCELPSKSTVVEVGCDRGRSSSLIFQMASAQKFMTIHIDPWIPEHDYGQQAYKAKEWMQVMCERCAYHPFILLHMTTEEAVRSLWNLTPKGIDFAFIDGAHDTPTVQMDLRLVASRVNQFGFLVAHDYPSGGVTEAIDPFVAQGWEKVKQARGLGIWRKL